MAGAATAERVTLFIDPDSLHAEWRIFGNTFLQLLFGSGSITDRQNQISS